MSELPQNLPEIYKGCRSGVANSTPDGFGKFTEWLKMSPNIQQLLQSLSEPEKKADIISVQKHWLSL